jgi:hypothetical protein
LKTGVGGSFGFLGKDKKKDEQDGRDAVFLYRLPKFIYLSRVKAKAFSKCAHCLSIKHKKVLL